MSVPAPPAEARADLIVPAAEPRLWRPAGSGSSLEQAIPTTPIPVCPHPITRTDIHRRSGEHDEAVRIFAACLSDGVDTLHARRGFREQWQQ